MIPEYLSQRADTEDLDRLIAVNIAQQQAEEEMKSRESDDDSQELQWILLKVWRDRAKFELDLLNRILQPVL